MRGLTGNRPGGAAGGRRLRRVRLPPAEAAARDRATVGRRPRPNRRARRSRSDQRSPRWRPARPTSTNGGVARRDTIAAARAAGLLDVDLGDGWAPFILQDGDGNDAKPNAYRETFIGLANEKLDADGDEARPGDHNYLEVFGIPPSLSVFAARVEADAAPAREACVDALDRAGLEQWTGDVIYLDRDRARREYDQAQGDAAWIDKSIAAMASDIPLTRGKGDRDAARGSEDARTRRPLHARAGTPARRARDAGADALRGAADATQPLHAGDVRSAVARGAGDLGAQARHLRLGFPGRRDAGHAAAADAPAVARGVPARARRARRRRGGHRRGRVDQRRSARRTRRPGATAPARRTRSPT